MCKRDGHCSHRSIGFEDSCDRAADRMTFGTSIFDVDACRLITSANRHWQRRVASRRGVKGWNVEIKTTGIKLTKWPAATSRDGVLSWWQPKDPVHASIVRFSASSQLHHVGTNH